jgi:hypothetical protein
MAPGLQFPVDLLMWGVANVCAIIAVCLFSALARKTLPAEAAWTAVVLFCFFPGSLFFSLAYTESLMALLTILFLRYLQKQQFVAAALAAGLTTACRPTGVALIPAFVWAYYRDERIRLAPIGRKLCSGTALLALSVSGLAAYMLYLQWRFGDPIAFARVPLVLPSWSEDWKWAMLSGRPIWKPLLEALWHNPLLLFVIPANFDALALATALLLLMAMLRWRAPSIWLILGFSLALMPYSILGGSSQGVAAMSRFLMVDIPLFLLGGLLLSKYRLHRVLLGIAVLLAIVLFVFSGLFASGEYFVG